MHNGKYSEYPALIQLHGTWDVTTAFSFCLNLSLTVAVQWNHFTFEHLKAVHMWCKSPAVRCWVMSTASNALHTMHSMDAACSGLMFLCSTCNWKQQSWHLILSLPYLFSAWKFKLCLFEITLQRPLRIIKNKSNVISTEDLWLRLPAKSAFKVKSVFCIFPWGVQLGSSECPRGTEEQGLIRSVWHFHLWDCIYKKQIGV